MEMIHIQGGTFQMGSNNGDGDEKPVHSVTVGDFYIGKTEVTQAQYEAVMGQNPSFRKGADLPVEQVSWFDAVEFCNILSEMEGLQKCYSGSGSNITCNFKSRGYRLPTEAEWEYAARGGNKSRGYEYSGSDEVNDVAWNHFNSDESTHQVGLKQPNELEIYDMSGNVWEWCWDWYDSYDGCIAQTNPVGPSSGERRVLRGGSWLHFYCFSVPFCRVAFRADNCPKYKSNYNGFRVVMSKLN